MGTIHLGRRAPMARSVDHWECRCGWPRPAPRGTPGQSTVDRSPRGGGLALPRRLACGVEASLLCRVGAARRSTTARPDRPPRVVRPPRPPHKKKRLASVGAHAPPRPSLRILSVACLRRRVGYLVARGIRLRGWRRGLTGRTIAWWWKRRSLQRQHLLGAPALRVQPESSITIRPPRPNRIGP